MNLLDATIIDIQQPIFSEEYGKWIVVYTYECWGTERKSERWFKHLEDAERMKVGDQILV